ncbi:hypothetical protein H7J87_12225 [Mycolicibacterium wolinskyi]|uniref:Uncharacterized protein n=1 Tax=Mycolicibacterium wolinskyi TaxID=59750 RepID=A0A1X2FJL5_9MYCO|nr:MULTISPECIES: hypothetical protein [Mycolicibacterium]MCV7286096.1 hypothetical protein [Mycolicibacterium wolinskyi]MCV7296292.1 hypothetical protein [Mycolicibacterium goodii]ORX18518.1 hypothetical protein AWC31_14555 [Mycolicibacterium wolinskyi]
MINEPHEESSAKRFLVQAVVDLEVLAEDQHAATTAASTAIRSTIIHGARRLDHSIRSVEEYRRTALPSDDPPVNVAEDRS